MRYVSNTTSATEFIKARETFNGSNMSGRKSPTGDVGRLPGAWRDVYYHTVNDIDYIVYSYSTPIAWHTNDGLWFVPGITYSATTSRHQSYALSAAMSDNNFTERVEHDRYYTSWQIMHDVQAWRETGSIPIHERSREYAYVTVRGVKPGDYVMAYPDGPRDGNGSWARVYTTDKRRGVNGSSYWVAVTYTRGDVYIGMADERIGRLR